MCDGVCSIQKGRPAIAHMPPNMYASLPPHQMTWSLRDCTCTDLFCGCPMGGRRVRAVSCAVPGWQRAAASSGGLKGGLERARRAEALG